MSYPIKLAVLALLIICLQIQKGYGFVIPPSTAGIGTLVSFRQPTAFSHRWQPIQIQNDRPLNQQPVLFASKSIDGMDRGIFLFSAVFAVCVWFFSVPPEFRRAHFCVVEKCVQNRGECYDCVTFSEWKTDVSDYYASGGGIVFDFTVAEETKDFWKDAISK